MAEVVDDMPPTVHGEHPWDEWLDGKIRKLTRGTDYDCDERLMADRAKSAAKRRCMIAKTSYNRRDGVVYIRAVREESA